MQQHHMQFRWEHPSYNLDAFGDRMRPAIVRFREDSRYSRVQGSHVNLTEATLYIDGHELKDLSPDEACSTAEIHIIQPGQWTIGKDPELKVMGIFSEQFNPDDYKHWIILFREYVTFFSKGDSSVNGFLTNALGRYSFTINTLQIALRDFANDEKKMIMDGIGLTAYCLGEAKQDALKELFNSMGMEFPAFFPDDIRDAVKVLGIHCGNRAGVHRIFDVIMESDTMTPDTDNAILRTKKWLDDPTMSIDESSLVRAFAFCGKKDQSKIIRRFFHDVKERRATFSEQFKDSLFSESYRYYCLQRHYRDSWPDKMDVTTEFILECISTYTSTREQEFQVLNGLLDKMIGKSEISMMPLKMIYHDWIAQCGKGLELNPHFKGFVDFKVRYTLEDETRFEEDALDSYAEYIKGRFCEQLYHNHKVPVLDPETGLQKMDENGAPSYRNEPVYEDKWRIRDDEGKRYVGIIVDWSRLPKRDTFTSNMISHDPAFVRQRVESYLKSKFGSAQPCLDIRSSENNDIILDLFGYKEHMSARFRKNVSLCNEYMRLPVEEHVIRDRVRNLVTDTFGDTLETEYDHSVLEDMKRKTRWRNGCDIDNDYLCFTGRIAKMNRHRAFCSPQISQETNFLTGKHFMECEGGTCFMTSLRRDVPWENYNLLHILTILGYEVFDETDAGLMPNKAYRNFTKQIGKAVGFINRLTCRECGHVLFTIKDRGRFNKYNWFQCCNPACKEYHKKTYLNYCFSCKKSLIDSRGSKKCPNGLYICPSCEACCSNEMFQNLTDRNRIIGRPMNQWLSRILGQGHADREMKFCHKCGSLKTDNTCPSCDPAPQDDTTPLQTSDQ